MVGAFSALQLFRSLQDKTSTILYGVIFTAGCLLSIYVWSQSTGTPVQDEIGHVVLARNAWNYPELIFDTWGRIANTLIFMIPALFGLNATRLAALVMSGATVLAASGCAQKMGVKHLYLVPLFLWFQPWYVSLSFTAITEVPFSLFLCLGMYFFPVQAS